MDDKTLGTRDRIVATAFSQFLRHGYDGTGLLQIVRESGVSKGAFYHYFASKADIYAEVVEAFFLKPFEEFDIAAIGALPGEGAKELLSQYYTSLPDSVRASTGESMARYFALFFESLSRLPAFHKSIRKIYLNLLENLRQTQSSTSSSDAGSTSAARRFLAGLEGELFLQAVLNLPKIEDQ